ncbi:hypothetical protein DEU34_2251 [Microbacterium sp. AG1240]|uniref:hypothetical protein n=1 Tax=Microbacterium sp. AG1240 TaxID=2183992 RepID=UPI000F164D79|nr:hypothetical protein [Microbacterium sp. AG1240]RKT33648.1 hypothetical protein DEU34_2251 [Microbacterium sp. AG1240]
MPTHLQDAREQLYAQAACGASLYTGPTVSLSPETTGKTIDCIACRAMLPDPEEES